MYNQYGQINPFQPNQYNQFAQRMEITKVNGIRGAEAFQMAANSSVLLLDTSEPIVWLKTTDGAGYPTITPYTITPYQPVTVDLNDLDARLKRLETMLNESHSSGADQQPTKSVKRANSD